MLMEYSKNEKMQFCIIESQIGTKALLLISLRKLTVMAIMIHICYLHLINNHGVNCPPYGLFNITLFNVSRPLLTFNKSNMKIGKIK